MNAGDLITGSASVVDGSSLDIKSNRIGIWGIDTPERGAWCYRNGTAGSRRRFDSRLRRCLQGKTVRVAYRRIGKFVVPQAAYI